ncbi:MAG: hypothetical protein IBX55_17700 [Methyloprofundus sp.]|nr:hypothetical protein [Methyloprofundus sp.]
MFLCIEPLTTETATFIEVIDPANCTIGFIAEPLEAYTSAPTLYDLFNVPLVEDVQTMFMLGFGLPIIAYLTAWAYGTLINWFNEPDENNTNY